MDAAKSIAANFQVTGAPVVTGQFTLNFGLITYNRGSGIYSQLIAMTNNGASLSAVALVADNLATGVTMVSPSGFTSVAAPAGSPYKEAGPIANGTTVNLVVQYTRNGTQAITFTPRLLGPGAR
jgi:hypothetical protein